jgi:hypothetical protein
LIFEVEKVMPLRKIHTETLGARVVKVYRDSDWAQFICMLYVDEVHYSPADYFTGDRDDAIDTAKAMVKPLKVEKREVR